MAQLLVNIVGYNSSGKTTVAEKLAESLGFNHIQGDAFRKFIYEHVAYFHGSNNSYPSKKNSELNPLIILYRLELARLLLRAGENVLIDGSGATHEQRQRILKVAHDIPGVKTVIIWADLPEEELLSRLAERDRDGARWTAMYHDHKKALFEIPTENEADILLRYHQNNYAEVENRLREILEESEA